MNEWMNEHFREKALGALHSFCLSLFLTLCVFGLFWPVDWSIVMDLVACVLDHLLKLQVYWGFKLAGNSLLNSNTRPPMTNLSSHSYTLIQPGKSSQATQAASEQKLTMGMEHFKLWKSTQDINHIKRRSVHIWMCMCAGH